MGEVQKVVVLAYFKIMSHNFHGGTVENHGKIGSSRSRFGLCTSWMWFKCSNLTCNTQHKHLKNFGVVEIIHPDWWKG